MYVCRMNKNMYYIKQISQESYRFCQKLSPFKIHNECTYVEQNSNTNMWICDNKMKRFYVVFTLYTALTNLLDPMQLD